MGSNGNGLSNKQRVFVEEYLKCWNATEAARRAEYAHPNKQGPKLLVNLGISKAIEVRIAELKMSTDEVLLRLADQAKGDISEFLVPNSLTLSVDKIHNKGHLIKSLTPTKEGHRIELHNSQSALQLIGKQLGLFDDTLTVKVEQELDKVLEHLQTVLDVDTYQKVIEALANE